MKLHAAATHFNRMVCRDAYTGTFLFKAQLGLFDDSKKDTEGSERRIIEVGPEVTLPLRRVIDAGGVKFILGHGHRDSALGKTIRVKHVAHEATALGKIRTLEELCLGLVGVDAYCARAWIKDSKEISESSELIGVNHIHFSSTETVKVNRTVLMDGQLHLVRKVNEGAAGTLIATCDELETPTVENVTFNKVTLDKVTETKTIDAHAVNVLKVRWQSLFRYDDSLSQSFKADECQIIVAKASLTPVVGSEVVMADGKYHVTAISSLEGVWVCRATKHD